jgi:Alpha-glucuronidase
MGNTVTKTETGTTVVANQEVNPNVLGRMSSINNSPGQDMFHEVTEAYEGAKISQSSGVSSPKAGISGSVYSKAHNAAVPQSGIVVESVNAEKTEVTYLTSPYLCTRPVISDPVGLKPILKVTF